MFYWGEQSVISHPRLNYRKNIIEITILEGQIKEEIMKITAVKSAPENPNPHNVSVRMLYNAENAQAIHIQLEPGQELRKHITPVDVFFYILEGQGIVEIGGEQEAVSKDMLIESPAKIPHRLLNKSEHVFRFLVVKAPRQTASTQIL